MTERLLQFIWQFQYFNKSELSTTESEPLQIILPGQFNTNQGPDFLDGKIKIETTLWAGSIELHIKTSDWIKHNHQNDANYNNVILHVVWEDDSGPIPITIETVPVLELKDRISKILLERYEELMNSASFIPCEKIIHTVKDISWTSWKDRLLAERLARKANVVESFLTQNNYHWEESFWWLLARNFGVTVNTDCFEAIARSLPLTILGKHKSGLIQLESLLFGQAGLLGNKYKEDYPKLLWREYKFLKGKYKLNPVHLPIHFLRMRPGNFPTIRLAQLAALINDSSHLFSKIKEANTVKEIHQWFDVTANDYWHYHYRFDEPSGFKKKNLGAAMTDNIIINTICPALFAYGSYHNDQKYKNIALKWLEQTGAENNIITKGFVKLGIENRNAFDSQALIELKNEYCNNKRCLECGVGSAILKQ